MPKIERKIEIESSPEQIYKVLMDTDIISKWNPLVNESEIETEKITLRTNLGDLKIVETESVENKKLTVHMDEGDIQSIGYILTSKKAKTNVILWAKFKDKKSSDNYNNLGDLLLKGLKYFIEFIEEGGNPEDYDKKQLLAAP